MPTLRISVQHTSFLPLAGGDLPDEVHHGTHGMRAVFSRCHSVLGAQTSGRRVVRSDDAWSAKPNKDIVSIFTGVRKRSMRPKGTTRDCFESMPIGNRTPRPPTLE